ncbi:hypothetical protein HDU76_013324 [Blyttiomyces sp. JEL0837]|nr:hypothetical protein HDU76_013324 [Blyttiomyces sp. JEL0837]
MGRRRPFIIFGAILMVIAVISIAYSREFGQLIAPGSVGSASQNATIFFAVLGFYLLDFSINAVTTSCRALIVDAVPLRQQNDASIWASRMAGFGNIVGYFTGFIDLMALFDGLATAHPVLFGSQLKILCFVSNAFLMSTLIMCCLSVTEVPYKGDNSASLQRWYDPLLSVFFAWLGWFPFLFYASAWVGQRVDSSITPDDKTDPRARAGAFALLLKAIISLIAILIIPLIMIRPTDQRPSAPRPKPLQHFLIKMLMLPGIWSWSLILFSILLFSTIFATDVFGATVIVAMAGICWGIVQWVPFALIAEFVAYNSNPDNRPVYATLPTNGDEDVADLISDDPTASTRAPPGVANLDAGLALGIHNIYIVLPQFLSTLLTSLIFTFLEAIGPKGDVGGGGAGEPLEIVVREGGTQFQSDPMDSFGWCLRAGAFATIVAGILAWNLREDRLFLPLHPIRVWKITIAFINHILSLLFGPGPPIAVRWIYRKVMDRRRSLPCENIQYDPDSPTALLDAFPIDQSCDDNGDKRALSPVIIFVFGGAWSSGDKSLYHPLASSLRNEGFVVVVPNYQLFPKAKVGAMIQDVAKTVQWTNANIFAYGGDKERIYLMGAGAHLCCLYIVHNMMCLLKEAAGPEFFGCDTTLPLLSGSPFVRGMILLAGVYDIANHLKHEERRGLEHISAMSRVMGSSKLLYDQFSPIVLLRKMQLRKGTAGLPVPFKNIKWLIIHGDIDHTVPPHQSEELYCLLKHDLGIDRVRLKIFPRIDHLHPVVEIMNGNSDYFFSFMEEITALIQK